MRNTSTSSDSLNSESSYRSWKAWTSSTFAVSDTENDRYFEAELRLSGLQNYSSITCFELGFGNGQFAAWAKKQGMIYRGSELNAELIDLAIEHGINAVPATLNLLEACNGERQDLIVAFDVLEHMSITDIKTLMSSANDCLTQNGLFLVRIPSGDSPFARHIQYGDFTHQTCIGSSMVRQLCIEVGMSVKQIRSPAFPITGLGFIKFIRRAPIVIARRVLTGLINLIFNDGQPRVISSNMLVVLQKNVPVL